MYNLVVPPKCGGQIAASAVTAGSLASLGRGMRLLLPPTNDHSIHTNTRTQSKQCCVHSTSQLNTGAVTEAWLGWSRGLYKLYAIRSQEAEWLLTRPRFARIHESSRIDQV